MIEAVVEVLRRPAAKAVHGDLRCNQLQLNFKLALINELRLVQILINNLSQVQVNKIKLELASTFFFINGQNSLVQLFHHHNVHKFRPPQIGLVSNLKLMGGFHVSRLNNKAPTILYPTCIGQVYEVSCPKTYKEAVYLVFGFHFSYLYVDAFIT